MDIELNGLVDAFKALGDPVRLRLFYLLSLRDELCVCHLTEALELPQSTVSRHLGVLRHTGLVSTRRDGKWMHYRLSEGLAGRLSDLIRAHHDPLHSADAKRLDDVLSACR